MMTTLVVPRSTRRSLSGFQDAPTSGTGNYPADRLVSLLDGCSGLDEHSFLCYSRGVKTMLELLAVLGIYLAVSFIGMAALWTAAVRKGVVRAPSYFFWTNASHSNSICPCAGS